MHTSRGQLLRASAGGGGQAQLRFRLSNERESKEQGRERGGHGHAPMPFIAFPSHPPACTPVWINMMSARHELLVLQTIK